MLVNKASANQPEWAIDLWKMLPTEKQKQSGYAFFENVGTASPDVALHAFQSSPTEVQELFLKSLCTGMAKTKPDEALRLAIMQTDTKLRVELTTKVFTYWAEAHPEAALAALEQNRDKMDSLEMFNHLLYGKNFSNMIQSIPPEKLRVKLAELSGKDSTPNSKP